MYDPLDQKQFDLARAIDEGIKGPIVLGLKFLKTMWALLVMPQKAISFLISDARADYTSYLRPVVFVSISTILYMVLMTTRNMYLDRLVYPRGASFEGIIKETFTKLHADLSVTGILLPVFPMVAWLMLGGYWGGRLLWERKEDQKLFVSVTLYAFGTVGLLHVMAEGCIDQLILGIGLVDSRSMFLLGLFQLCTLGVAFFLYPPIILLSAIKHLDHLNASRSGWRRAFVIGAMSLILGPAYSVISSLPAGIDRIWHPNEQIFVKQEVVRLNGLELEIGADLIIENAIESALVFGDKDIECRMIVDLIRDHHVGFNVSYSFPCTVKINDSSSGAKAVYIVNAHETKWFGVELKFQLDKARIQPTSLTLGGPGISDESEFQGKLFYKISVLDHSRPISSSQRMIATIR